MRETIEQALPPLQRRLFRRDVEALAGELEALAADPLPGASARFHGGLRQLLERVQAALQLVRRSTDERRLLSHRYDVLRENAAAAETELERRDLIMGFLAQITPPERLRGDRRALDRHLGLDAVAERVARLQERRGRREELLVRVAARDLEQVLRNVLLQDSHRSGPIAAGQRPPPSAAGLRRVHDLAAELDVEPLLLEQARGQRRWQNRVAALEALEALAVSLPPEARRPLLSVDGLNYVIRCCFDREEVTWVQCAALSLLAAVSDREARDVLKRRLLRWTAHHPDDMFVRARAVRLLPRVLDEPAMLELLRSLLERPEPSELVRMEAARAIAGGVSLEAERLLLQVLRGEERYRDPSPRVRIEAATLWRRKSERSDAHREIAARTLAWLIRHDPALPVRRAALEEAAALAASRQAEQRRYKVDAIDHLLLDAMDEVARTDPDVRLRRLAADAREAIVVQTLAAFDWVRSRLVTALDALDEHGELEISTRELVVPEALLGRVLAYFTRDDFGLCIERRDDRYIIRKGDRYARRLWRILHEVRNPDSAKRQAHPHTRGRVLRGHLRVPPGTLAELVETKVPGERLWNASELSWRRFLPLVDDYLSTFSWLPWRRQRRIAIYSSEGVTEILDGRTWWQALRDHLRMSWRYARLAELRNACPSSRRGADRSAFVRAMRDDFRIETRFRPHGYAYAGSEFLLDDPTLAEHFRHGSLLGAARHPAPEAAPPSGDTPGAETPRSPAQGSALEDTADEVTPAGIEEEAAEDPKEAIDDLLRPLRHADSSTGNDLADDDGPDTDPEDSDLGELDDDGPDALLAPAAHDVTPRLSPDETHPELSFAPPETDPADQAAPPVRHADLDHLEDEAAAFPEDAWAGATASQPLAEPAVADPEQTPAAPDEADTADIPKSGDLDDTDPEHAADPDQQDTADIPGGPGDQQDTADIPGGPGDQQDTADIPAGPGEPDDTADGWVERGDADTADLARDGADPDDTAALRDRRSR